MPTRSEEDEEEEDGEASWGELDEPEPEQARGCSVERPRLLSHAAGRSRRGAC